MLKTLLRVTLLLALLTAVAFWVSLRAFHVFLEEDSVAIVRCEPAPAGSLYRFLVEIQPVEHGLSGRREKFPMSGDQWSIGGDILKWKPWLTFLGLKSCHRLNRLNSRYERAGDELEKPRAAYDLNGRSQPVWRWLHRWGMALPFVDAVYGNSVYIPLRPGGKWGVYVTHSGYLIRPLRNK